MPSRKLPAGDQTLVQIVDAALADANRRSGSWIVCRPGCTQCCIGVFPISPLDAARLRESVDRLSGLFPGDPKTGILAEGENAEQRFADFANDEPCPALDPASGMCDLYAYRPITCRAFGPPVRSEDGLGVCELCFHGATDQQIAACEMEVDPEDLESALLKELETSDGRTGRAIIAFVLAD